MKNEQKGEAYHFSLLVVKTYHQSQFQRNVIYVNTCISDGIEVWAK